MNIFKTFEIFMAAPLSIIQHRPIRVVHVEANIFAQAIPIDVNINDNVTEITVYNNEKVYNLLSCVLHRQKTKNENNQSKIHN